MKLVKIVMVLLALGLLASCAAVEAPAAQGPETESEGEMAAGEEITLRYFMWDPSFEETEQKMVDKFMDEHPSITIDFETVGTPDYWTKMSALSAADDLPCVFNMSAGFVDQWISDGLLYNIQPFVDESISGDDYFTGVFDVTRDKSSGDNMHSRSPSWRRCSSTTRTRLTRPESPIRRQAGPGISSWKLPAR